MPTASEEADRLVPLHKVRSCPFCSSSYLHVPDPDRRVRDRPSYVTYVACYGCGAEGPNVWVKQTRLDGKPYAHNTRCPKGQVERWGQVCRDAALQAITLWNNRW